MLSLSTGHDTRYLTDAVAGGREGYYTGAVAAGEPAGLWYGAGVGGLGLAGEVDATVMEAVYSRLLDPRDPAARGRETWDEARPLARGHRAYRSADRVYDELVAGEPGAGPERRAELRAQADRSARQAVSFIDATFSAPKSVTVLAVAFERAANDARATGDADAAAAWAAHQRAVEDAVMAGARAAIDYLQDVAGYSRVGHHGGGAGRWTDAHEWVVAQFLQHDSRDRDPQLHVHQAILNRARCADGQWRALDSRAIHAHRGAAGAIAERVMEAHLARSLGVRFETRPDGRAREIVGVPQPIMDMFSSRRRAISARAGELVAAYRARHGREPSALERTRIAQQATLATRRAKAHDGETLTARLDRWEAETRAELDGGLAAVARAVLDRAQASDPAARWEPRDVIERALAAVGDARQTWTRSDLTRAISDALPAHLDLAPGRVRVLLDGLTDAALDSAVEVTAGEDTTGLTPDLLRGDGRSVYERPGGARYATPGQLAAERTLAAAAVERGAPTLAGTVVDGLVARFADHGRELGADQAAALRGVLTSGARVEVLSAAAGTGKSFVVGAIADAWTDPHRHTGQHGDGRAPRVVGLATSQAAAGVLADEGMISANVAAWLGAQRRLADARPGQPSAGGDEAWRLHAGDLVVVDEAGMTATGDLLAVQQRCAAAGAKLLLVGDPRQLAAVGPGGALAELAERGLRYELTEVRRFTNAWEGAASLRLRDGDPAALADYERHGRLVDAGTAEQAETAAGRAWLADTIAGRDALLLVGTNEAAARVSAALRAELVALGRVAERGVPLAAPGCVAGVGDRVQARRNAWHLIGHDGNTRAPINRETYTVTELLPGGGLRVVDTAGVPVVLPAGYVTEHLALGYASTVHAAQGRTVDTGHAVLGSTTDPGSAYVSLTRGRDRNTAWTITRAVGDDTPTGATLDTAARTARAVIADALAVDPGDVTDRTATAQAAAGAHDTVSMRRHLDRLAAEIADATAGRTARWLDRLAADHALPAHQREALAADPATDTLARLLRTAELAGHDPAAVLADAVAGRTLAGSRSPAQVLHSRISKALDGRLDPHLRTYRDLIPAGLPAERADRLAALADAADQRRHQLGAATAVELPQWAREALGRIPDDPTDRAGWETRAGWAAAYREVAGHADVADALGSAPPAGLAETHAAWRAAHTALDLPDAGADEAEMSDGQLRARVRAWERERPWAPAYVADDLAAAEQAAQRARADATVWAARADTADDPAEADRLRRDADDATAAADRLDQQVADLDQADTARARWWAHTAVTRDHAARARAALGARGVDLDRPAEQVTADEWLAVHRADQVEQDRHRDVTAGDVLDDRPADADDLLAADDKPALTAVPDVRDDATAAPGEYADRDQVLDVDDTAAAVARAQAALAEIAARQTVDDRADRDAADERADQLARRTARDRQHDQVEHNDRAEHGPVLDR
ncbi:MobF family relaxase [Pseudonocardia sp. UM4_GMWB1]|uniref:MobF family relaxase n=1 Tax=Pseudonocardia sp. UM4_GMWB1 TaxID=2212989 RepID=UPI00307CCE4D